MLGRSLLATAAGAAAARRASGSAARLVRLPLFDRFAAESPIATDAEPGQASLSEQAVYRCRMNAQVFRQFLDCKNLIALSHLSHTLGGPSQGRHLLRRAFFHSWRPARGARFQFASLSLRSWDWLSQDALGEKRSSLRTRACKSVTALQANSLLSPF